MKINFFRSASPFFPFRWFIVFVVLMVSVLTYANLSGWRILAGGQQQWNANGPGGHHK